MFLACRSGYSTYGPTLLISLGVNCFELHWFFTRTCHHVLTSKSSKLMFPTVSHCFPLFPTVSHCFPILRLSKTGPKIAFHPLIYRHFPTTLPKNGRYLHKNWENIQISWIFHGFPSFSPFKSPFWGPKKKKPDAPRRPCGAVAAILSSSEKCWSSTVKN